jgi:hypothetical protein
MFLSSSINVAARECAILTEFSLPCGRSGDTGETASLGDISSAAAIF